MAYFSNGTEGMSFQERQCLKCIHEPNCTIWLLHLLHNYDQCGETPEAKRTKEMLDTLIPRGKGCTMFHAATDAEIAEMRDDVKRGERMASRTEIPAYRGKDEPAPWIKDWLAKKGGRA